MLLLLLLLLLLNPLLPLTISEVTNGRRDAVNFRRMQPLLLSKLVRCMLDFAMAEIYDKAD